MTDILLKKIEWGWAFSGALSAASSMDWECFEVRRPIVNFLPLILRVLSNATPSGIHRSRWVTRTLSKESLELNPWRRSHCLALTLVLMPTKADPTIKEQSRKRGMVEANSADGIDMILTLLEHLLSGLRVRDDWLESEGINPCKTCHRPKVFLGVLSGCWGGD